MEGVDPDSDMEAILSTVLDQAFVAANTSSLQSLGGKLLKLIGPQMDGERELVNSGLANVSIIIIGQLTSMALLHFYIKLSSP